MAALRDDMTTQVKICGVRGVYDAVLAAELGAAASGFVCWPACAFGLM